MSPAWAQVPTGADGGAGPTPLTPPSEGLIFWVKGDAGLTVVDDLAQSWADQSGFGQDLDGAYSGDQLKMHTGVFDIDGVPCVSGEIEGNPHVDHSRYIWRSTPLLDRNGAQFGFGVGQRQQRTIMAAFVPVYSLDSFGFTGGTVCGMVGSIPEFQGLFALRDDTPNVYFLGNNGFGTAFKGPNIAGGSGGPYNGVPTVSEWNCNGFPDIGSALNGVTSAIDPATQPGSVGGGTTKTIVGNSGVENTGFNFVGGISEVLIWDYDLRTAPTARAQAYNYFVSRYPSAPIVVP